MNYRLAEKNDIPRLSEMRWAFKIEDSDEIKRESKREFLARCSEFYQTALNNNWHCWVAEENETIVSHMFIQKVDRIPSPDESSDPIGYLTNVYTVPEYRNAGIGTLLLCEVKKWSIHQGFVLLIVWPSERSVPFYERAGFTSDNEVLELRFSK